MSIRHIIFQLMVLTMLLVANQAVAQDNYEKDENFEVPDSYYINNRCREPQDSLKRVKDNKELLQKVDINSVELVASTMTSLCEMQKKELISGDLWLVQFDSMSSILGTLTNVVRLPFMSAEVKITPPKPIPDNFKAYTMFLFPSDEWSKPELRENLRDISQNFSSFGSSIGDERAAIWFTNDRQFHNPIRGRYSHVPDIKRSKYYCDLLKLNYNDGPYIVTSLKRPDLLYSKEDLIVIKLGGIAPQRIVKVLNILEQDLRTEAKVRKRSLYFEEIKQRLLSVGERNSDIVKELAKDTISVIFKH